MKDVEKIIKKLKLKPLPLEGGLYRETYRNFFKIRVNDKERELSSAIYYLLTKGVQSKWHRLESDEIWHFYLGDPVNLYLIYPDGRKRKMILGNNILKGESPQILVPAYTIQSAKLKKGGEFALVGTTVTPAFNFEDFELINP